MVVYKSRDVECCEWLQSRAIDLTFTSPGGTTGAKEDIAQADSGRELFTRLYKEADSRSVYRKKSILTAASGILVS